MLIRTRGMLSRRYAIIVPGSPGSRQMKNNDTASALIGPMLVTASFVLPFSAVRVLAFHNVGRYITDNGNLEGKSIPREKRMAGKEGKEYAEQVLRSIR